MFIGNTNLLLMNEFTLRRSIGLMQETGAKKPQAVEHCGLWMKVARA